MDKPKTLARAIFKRIWVKNREIRKIELNPPFDFLLKDRAKKIKSDFSDLKLEHYLRAQKRISSNI